MELFLHARGGMTAPARQQDGMDACTGMPELVMLTVLGLYDHYTLKSYTGAYIKIMHA